MEDRSPEVGPAQVEAFFREKRLAREAAGRALHEKARAEAQAIVAMIVEKYRPTRVLHWGSILRPEQFRDYSDIDIAVEGITDAEQFFAMYGDAEAMTRFPLDLVQLEKIEPEYRRLIETRGQVVYRREG